MVSSTVFSILDSARGLPDPIRVFGTSAPVRALIAARASRELSASGITVVLCPNQEQAEALANDAESLLSILDSEQTEKPISVQYFPEWEQSLYSPIVPSLRTRLSRISSLGRLAGGETHSILIFTTWAAACQRTIPKEVLQKFSTTIQVNGSIGNREQLIQRLTNAGYMRVDPVEDPGTFAVRGEIFDIFPPGADVPYRVELFGDDVERIRTFDPKTQKPLSVNSLEKILIGPSREVLINAETTPTIRERIKTYADDNDISRAVRDPVLHSVAEGIYPDHSDAWAPFSYTQSATLWNYLDPSHLLLIWDDEMASHQEWDHFLREQLRLSEEAKTSGLILPPVHDLYSSPKELENFTKEKAKIFFDRVEMLDTAPQEEPPEDAPTEASKERGPSAHQRVSIKSNADLGATPRRSLTDLEPKFGLWLKQGFRTGIVATTQSQADRIHFLLGEHNIPSRIQKTDEKLSFQTGHVTIFQSGISEGFRWPAEGLILLTENEILGTKARAINRRNRERGSASKEWSGLQALADLSIGDTIVHIDHGIGRYQGLSRLELSGAPSDFLLVEYANKDKLYIPVYRLNVVQKYVGAGESVALDKLGGTHFAKAKEKVKEAVKKLAVDLVQLYAERKVRPGILLSPRDADFREFEAKFPYQETPDQLKAIDDMLSDLESGRAMDRLICGDVGYGKTEVAIRAAFKAVSDGKQVAVLVPTTILAQQHEQSFRARLQNYPIQIESLSRFKGAKEQKATLELVAQGKVDILIGTHRLLSRDIRFKDLALIVVDEEHRFGVEHKEKLKTLKVNCHVLTLTATPIPRTLHMALSGLRDISLINTPPMDRLPIRTYVSKFDESLIKRAIEMELSRDGQVFVVHNRVESIYNIATQIRELVPNALVSVAHGQMADGELEDAMIAFYGKKSNVMVCTTIIESGLDVPSANTMIVNHADRLGLAQLYQIRGRVGRAQQRAYCYLLIPPEKQITEDAKRRLDVIQRFVELGSGFSVASHDLEIRGGGDVLGPQQSGHIAQVGFDLYTELLEEAIREIQGKPLTPEQSTREPEIRVPYAAYLSEEYVPDVHQRLSLYRRFSATTQEMEIQSLEEELRDRYGQLPAEAQSLLWLIRLKQLLKRYRIDSLSAGPEKLSLTPGSDSALDPVQVIALVSRHPGRYQVTPDPKGSKLVVKISTASLSELFLSLEQLLKGIEQ